MDNIGGDPYGYTGEWYEGYIELLHLRARWYVTEDVHVFEPQPDAFKAECYQLLALGDIHPMSCNLPRPELQMDLVLENFNVE